MSFRCVHRSCGAESADLVLAMYTVRKPVNRCPLRAAYVGATLSTLLALVTAQGALGARQRATEPRRAGRGHPAPGRAAASCARGRRPSGSRSRATGSRSFRLVLQGTKGSETVWSVRLRANAAPGQVPFVLRAVYAGGEAGGGRPTVHSGARAGGVSFPWAGVVAARCWRWRSRSSRSASLAAGRSLIASHLVLFQQFVGRRPRLCVVSGRRRGCRRRCDRRSSVRDRAGAGRRPPSARWRSCG